MAAAARTATGEKEKNGDLFLQCSAGSSGWDGGESGWGNLGAGSKSNLAAGNREASALGRSPSSLFAVSDGLLL